MHAVEVKPPNDAHLDGHNSHLDFKVPVGDEVHPNLALCDDAKYVAKDNIPGLNFAKMTKKSGPIRRRRQKKRCGDDNSNGIPGIHIKQDCVRYCNVGR